ncbi:hydantoinase B/oxoprolinase family protein, partial [Candidatus Hodarchaeum mangrovi]
KFCPYGLFGGEAGAKGINIKITKDNKEIQLPGRVIISLKEGESLKIMTPGGGGYGKRESEDD